ncbi:MAG: glycerol-3-phosphate 1-O-acyltransferase PlsY [Pseudomonadota bacterium]
MMFLTILFSAVLGYGLGSIPFGLVLTKLAGLGDIRAVGSGNIGATNVLRTGRKDLALLTLLLDSGKGAIAVFAAMTLDWRPEIAAAFAMLGHCFPVWLGFRGGKGVATYLGTILMLLFPAGLFACLTWLVTAGVTRISSLSALVATAATPLILFAMGRPAYCIAALGMTGFVFIRHKANIARLIKGTEPKIGRKSDDPAPERDPPPTQS